MCRGNASSKTLQNNPGTKRGLSDMAARYCASAKSTRSSVARRWESTRIWASEPASAVIQAEWMSGNQHFHEDSGVVGVPNVAERTGGDDAEAGRVHDLNVPMIAEGANDPPANEIGGQENDEADCGENGIEGTVEEHHFDGGTDQNGGVQEHHPAKTGIIHFGGATGDHFPLVAAG